MTPTNKEGLSQVIAVLEETAAKIRRVEAQAREALYENDDQEGYRQKMKEKTELLMELPEQADEAVEKLEGPLRQEVESGLDDFSRRAGQAMASGSVFFMYALLYPEDYREGDENDLENYIESLRARA